MTDKFSGRVYAGEDSEDDEEEEESASLHALVYETPMFVVALTLAACNRLCS